MINLKRLVLLLFIVFISFTNHASTQNFNWAKRQLIIIYGDDLGKKEFYCNCDFTLHGGRSKIALSECGYRTRKNPTRALRIEWEHVMPAHQFGGALLCWVDGGRGNCKKNPQFKLMEGDLHNLQPAIGEVNADRSNYHYAVFTKNYDQYGQCEAATNFANKQFQPREAIRGMIGRTYRYMSTRYNIKLSHQEAKLMQTWDKRYPPKQWECKRNRIIQQIQGNDNPFISKKCKSPY